MQNRMHQTQLKNCKAIAIQEATEFIKSQSEAIQKLLTKEHHKLILRFIDFKARTKERCDKVEQLEATVFEMTMNATAESSIKEA